jgi:hypothetical protein
MSELTGREPAIGGQGVPGAGNEPGLSSLWQQKRADDHTAKLTKQLIGWANKRGGLDEYLPQRGQSRYDEDGHYRWIEMDDDEYRAELDSDPDYGTWVTLETAGYTGDRSSELLHESNVETIGAYLERELDNENTNTVRAGRNSVEVRVLDAHGNPIEAAVLAAWDVIHQLDDYPVWDDEDWSRREYEANYESLESELAAFEHEFTEAETSAVWQWLYENYDEATYEYHGEPGYFHDFAIEIACYDLGYLTEGETDEFMSLLVRDACEDVWKHQGHSRWNNDHPAIETTWAHIKRREEFESFLYAAMRQHRIHMSGEREVRNG